MYRDPKNVILIHGCCDKEEFFDDKYPSGSNSHWFPWLQKQLIKQGIETQTPEMPTPYNPNYQRYQKIFNQFIINSKTILVGHSCGAGFLLRWLSENNKTKIDKLILVAPWLDPIKKRKNFLDFKIDPRLEKNIKEIHLFFSKDEDVKGVKESIDIILKILPKTQVHIFDNMGHFTLGDMKTEKFPELLQIISQNV